MENSEVILGIDDLVLLETFQIEKLTRISLQREIAAVLHAYPKIQYFLIHKNPSISVIGLGDMEEALTEVERVVKPEGYAIHLQLRPNTSLEKEKLASLHQNLTSPTWNYQFEEVDLSDFKETGVMSANARKIKYWKQLASEE
ncbi:MAG: hypothetical protein JSW11_15800 [Candidatus Heimdallarchaeota archaeon]|nr:MAG: hypothetical protein JSW11_15800 [Candidatus Heimdallarchaeota archaeon]